MSSPLPASLPLLGGALRWAPQAARPSEDAFWLAACVPPTPAHTRVLDMGCGNGAVGLALLARHPSLALTGADCDPTALAEAAQNAALNPFAAHAQWQEADVLSPLWAPSPPWPVVVCNPPFHPRAQGHNSPSPRKALAHGLTQLTPWVATWARTVAPQGHLYAILHAQLHPLLLQEMEPYGGHLSLAPMATHPTRAPKRLLIHWHATGQPFCVTPCGVVPSYNSTLRRAVLDDAKPLAPFVSP